MSSLCSFTFCPWRSQTQCVTKDNNRVIGQTYFSKSFLGQTTRRAKIWTDCITDYVFKELKCTNYQHQNFSPLQLPSKNIGHSHALEEPWSLSSVPEALLALCFTNRLNVVHLTYSTVCPMLDRGRWFWLWPTLWCQQAADGLARCHPQTAAAAMCNCSWEAWPKSEKDRHGTGLGGGSFSL